MGVTADGKFSPVPIMVFKRSYQSGVALAVCFFAVVGAVFASLVEDEETLLIGSKILGLLLLTVFALVAASCCIFGFIAPSPSSDGATDQEAAGEDQQSNNDQSGEKRSILHASALATKLHSVAAGLLLILAILVAVDSKRPETTIVCLIPPFLVPHYFSRFLVSVVATLAQVGTGVILLILMDRDNDESSLVVGRELYASILTVMGGFAIGVSLSSQFYAAFKAAEMEEATLHRTAQTRGSDRGLALMTMVSSPSSPTQVIDLVDPRRRTSSGNSPTTRSPQRGRSPGKSRSSGTVVRASGSGIPSPGNSTSNNPLVTGGGGSQQQQQGGGGGGKMNSNSLRVNTIVEAAVNTSDYQTNNTEGSKSGESAFYNQEEFLMQTTGADSIAMLGSPLGGGVGPESGPNTTAALLYFMNLVTQGNVDGATQFARDFHATPQAADVKDTMIAMTMWAQGASSFHPEAFCVSPSGMDPTSVTTQSLQAGGGTLAATQYNLLGSVRSMKNESYFDKVRRISTASFGRSISDREGSTGIRTQGSSNDGSTRVENFTAGGGGGGGIHRQSNSPPASMDHIASSLSSIGSWAPYDNNNPNNNNIVTSPKLQLKDSSHSTTTSNAKGASTQQQQQGNATNSNKSGGEFISSSDSPSAGSVSPGDSKPINNSNNNTSMIIAQSVTSSDGISASALPPQGVVLSTSTTSVSKPPLLAMHRGNSAISMSQRAADQAGSFRVAITQRNAAVLCCYVELPSGFESINSNRKDAFESLLAAAEEVAAGSRAVIFHTTLDVLVLSWGATSFVSEAVNVASQVVMALAAKIDAEAVGTLRAGLAYGPGICGTFGQRSMFKTFRMVGDVVSRAEMLMRMASFCDATTLLDNTAAERCQVTHTLRPVDVVCFGSDSLTSDSLVPGTPGSPTAANLGGGATGSPGWGGGGNGSRMTIHELICVRADVGLDEWHLQLKKHEALQEGSLLQAWNSAFALYKGGNFEDALEFLNQYDGKIKEEGKPRDRISMLLRGRISYFLASSSKQHRPLKPEPLQPLLSARTLYGEAFSVDGDQQ